MKTWERINAFAPYTALFGATGQPAMSVPLFWNKVFRYKTKAYESSSPWKLRTLEIHCRLHPLALEA
jgi:hypothetical protein